jgi:putative hemolysin
VLTTELVIILCLLLINGVFAMSEIAVVTARKVRLQHRAGAGDKRAAAALRLKEEPTQFLSTVQVGITLVGILAGAFGGAKIAGRLALWLARAPALAPYADVLALVVVVGCLTYLSLIIGELVPKALALHDPERIAGLVAAPVAAVARLATPLVSLLSLSTNLVLRLLRVDPAADRGVTEEEIRALLKQAALSGDVERVEHAIVEQVFRLGDRRVTAIMTPRHDIDWLDVHDGIEGIREHLRTVRHPRLLVCDGELDKVLGIARAEEVLASVLAGGTADLRPLLIQPIYVPESMLVYRLIDTFQGSRSHLALVLDEFGAIAGIVTPTDLLEGLVGAMPTATGEEEGPIHQRDAGSWLVDGTLPIEDLRATIEAIEIPEGEQGTYQTLAGLVMTRLGHVPRTGDRFTWGALRFEVVDMDGRRVDKVLIERI